MRQAWFRAMFLGTMIVMGFEVLSSNAAAAPPTPAELKEALKQQWESIETIEFVCDEHEERVNGTPVQAGAYLRYETSRAKGGLTSFGLKSILADGGVRTLFHLIEDGESRIDYTLLPSKPEMVSTAIIRAQESFDSGIRKSAMSSVMWLTTPGDAPIYEHITENTRIREVEEAGGRLVEVIFPVHGIDVRCLLDPDRDWSASSVEFLNGERIQWKVEKYQRDNGRWFPAEGRASGILLGEYKERRFLVTDLKINRTIEPGRFKPLALPTGALVDDVRKGTRKVHGGNFKTRAAFLERVLGKPTPAAPTADEGEPIVASIDAEETDWGPITAGASVCLLTIAGLITAARRRGR